LFWPDFRQGGGRHCHNVFREVVGCGCCYSVFSSIVISLCLGYPAAGGIYPLAQQKYRNIPLSTISTVSPYRLGTFDGIVKKNMPGKLFFFAHQPVPLCCMYVLCTRGRHNLLLIEDLVRLRAQKHKPTMTSAASPRATNPKMVESPASMVHAFSSYACAEDGYFKRPHTMSIDGDIWLNSCWFFVGFGVGRHLTHN
jgi:hypothetical protein